MSKKVFPRVWTTERLAGSMKQTSWSMSGFLCGEKIATKTCTKLWETFAANISEQNFAVAKEKNIASFHATLAIEISAKPSFYITLPRVSTRTLYIIISWKSLSLWRNLKRDLDGNNSVCWNARPLRGVRTLFLSRTSQIENMDALLFNLTLTSVTIQCNHIV